MSRLERRRPIFDSELLARTALVWIPVSLVLLLANWRQIAWGDLPDADDALRLTRLHALVAGQDWFDPIDHRIAPQSGLGLEPAHLADLPLYLFDRTLAPLFGSAMAERLAMVVLPLLVLGLIIVLAARIAWRLIDPRLIGWIGGMALVIAPLAAQVMPLRIDDHGWQMVAVLAAANGLIARSARRGAWIAGLAMGVGLAFSLDLALAAFAFAVLFALRWLRDPRDRDWLVTYIPALGLAAAAGFLGGHGATDLDARCDSLSLPIVGTLAMLAGGTWLLGMASPLPRIPTAAGFLAIAAASISCLLWAAPACTASPASGLGLPARILWFDQVGERLPLWHMPLSAMLALELPVVLGLVGALRLGAQSRDWLRRLWYDYALLLALLAPAPLLAAKLGLAGVALALVPFAWALHRACREARRQPHPMRRAVALTAIAALASPTVPVALGRLAWATEARAGTPPARADATACNVHAAAAALDRLPAGLVLATPDVSASVLVASQQPVLATPHLRAARQIDAAYAALLAAPAQQARTLGETRARYVLICPGSAETTALVNASPQGLTARLLNAAPVDGLSSVPLPAQSGFKLWTLRPDTGSSPPA